MRTHYRRHKPALLLAAGALLLMMLLVWVLPVSFCGYLESDMDTNFWYFISESAGVYGTTILSLLLCTAAAWQHTGLRNQARAFVGAFGFLLVTLGGIALTNEFVVKPLTQIPRPSHRFLLRSTEQAGLLPRFYLHTPEERRIFLEQYLKQHPEVCAAVSPRVLSHWVHETGYSFPSGHSQNAFLFGSLLVLWLGLALPRRKYYWLALPLGWAILVCLSRVAVGVHSEWDVSIGAAFGFIIAYLLSLSGILHKVFRVMEEDEPAGS